jgi:hypothetical protein
MTLYEYLMLSDDEQYDVVFAKGKFLDIHIVGNTKLVLYAIDLFFVEVKWGIEKDEIIGKAAFKYGPALDKYGNVPNEF